MCKRVSFQLLVVLLFHAVPVHAAVLLSGQASDAAGDTFDRSTFAGDLTFAKAEVTDSGEVIFTVRFEPGSFDPGSTQPTILIDTDNDPNTGSRGLDTADTDEALIGPEVSIAPAPFTGPNSAVITYLRRDMPPSLALEFSNLALALEDGWEIRLPLERVGGDGQFTFAVLSSQALSPSSSTPINDYLPTRGVAKPFTTSGLVASVLPVSRAVQTGTSATVFATIINTGAAIATGCAPSLPEDVDANFSYRSTDPATNLPVGTPDTPVELAPGASATFLLQIEPRSARTASEVAVRFVCDNVPEAAPIVGVNGLLLAVEDDPVADMVALALSPSGDGVMRLEAPEALGFFALASVNVGVADTLSLSADTGSVSLPMEFLLCQTDPVTAACINPTSPSTAPVSIAIEAGATPTFAIFASAFGAVDFDPSRNRVYARFADQNGRIRGATSVAVSAVGSQQLTLNFDSPVGGTLEDASGQGVGLTRRLPGTGSSVATTDPNLFLNTQAGELEVTTTPADLNGQINLDDAQYLGFSLSEEGVSGTDDFSLTAVFANVPTLEFIDQIGVFVGASSTTALRGGIFAVDSASPPELFAVLTSEGLDAALQRVALPSTTTAELILRRINGNYTITVNGTNVPTPQPTFDSEQELFVGIFAAHPGNSNAKTLRVQSLELR